MIPWNALPWNTIAIIIGLSLLLSSLLTILFIKKRRFEDLGMVIGVFLIILSSVSYFYLIPNEIVDNAMLPEDYVWEDTGNIQYWERNSVFPHDRSGTYTPFEIQKLVAKRPPIEKNFTGKEIIHAAHFDSNEKEMIIHDAIYDENGEIFRVINRNEEVSEWYRIDPYLSSLKYVSVDAGHMGIPSNLGGAHSIQMGWVESTGEKDGEESIVLLRDMQKIKTGYIDGVEVTVWQSDIYNKPITWHGESYICDETLRLTVNPKTGYIVNVYRHLLLSAHLSKFIELYYPDTLRFRSVVNYLKLNDPIGEAAELTYETTAKSQDGHIAEVKALQGQMIYIPMAICVPLFLIGTALTWRYCGGGFLTRQQIVLMMDSYRFRTALGIKTNR